MQFKAFGVLEDVDVDVLHEEGIGVDGRKRGQAALARGCQTCRIDTNIYTIPCCTRLPLYLLIISLEFKVV